MNLFSPEAVLTERTLSTHPFAAGPSRSLFARYLALKSATLCHIRPLLLVLALGQPQLLKRAEGAQDRAPDPHAEPALDRRGRQRSDLVFVVAGCDRAKKQSRIGRQVMNKIKRKNPGRAGVVSTCQGALGGVSTHKHTQNARSRPKVFQLFYARENSSNLCRLEVCRYANPAAKTKHYYEWNLTLKAEGSALVSSEVILSGMPSNSDPPPVRTTLPTISFRASASDCSSALLPRKNSTRSQLSDIEISDHPRSLLCTSRVYAHMYRLAFDFSGSSPTIPKKGSNRHFQFIERLDAPDSLQHQQQHQRTFSEAPVEGGRGKGFPSGSASALTPWSSPNSPSASPACGGARP